MPGLLAAFGMAGFSVKSRKTVDAFFLCVREDRREALSGFRGRLASGGVLGDIWGGTKFAPNWVPI